MALEKILPLGTLASKLEESRTAGHRIVLCHGTFDLMHAGHIRHIQQSREQGDILIVTITADQHVNRGPGRPVFNQQLRAETLAALEYVDYVSVHDGPTAIGVIEVLKPDVYMKGIEYATSSNDITGNIQREQAAVEIGGGRIAFTDDVTFSSSSLLNEHFNVFPQETSEYIRGFRQRYSINNVLDMLRSVRDLRVLVIGDAIIDEYHYTKPLGRTGKGSALSVRFDNAEQFAGGAIAVANHVGAFVDDVTLITGLGGENSYEHFIRSRLGKSVKPEFFFSENADTLVKRRFVDTDLNKLFEVYVGRADRTAPEVEYGVCEWLRHRGHEYDAVIVPDFGNGFISDAMVERISAESRFLAVNTQLNSGNYGFHAIDRYNAADFVSLNEPELRMAARNRREPIEKVARAVAETVRARRIAVTRGPQGVVMLDRNSDEIHQIPALSTKVVDRVGAGDAFLSLASTCLGAGLPSEVATFVGSAAAALDVQIVCNRETVGMANLFKYITTLLK